MIVLSGVRLRLLVVHARTLLKVVRVRVLLLIAIVRGMNWWFLIIRAYASTLVVTIRLFLVHSARMVVILQVASAKVRLLLCAGIGCGSRLKYVMVASGVVVLVVLMLRVRAIAVVMLRVLLRLKLLRAGAKSNRVATATAIQVWCASMGCVCRQKP